MTHLIYNNKEFVLSRERNTKIELVDLDSGELLIIPDEEKAKFTSIKQIFKPVVPCLVLFSQRSASFLADLRAKREQYLRDVREKKIKARKTDKSLASGKTQPTNKHRSKVKKVSESFAQSLASLPPDLQALLREAR